MISEMFKWLIDKIILKNGEGHKELEKHVKNGTISKEQAELIMLQANMQQIQTKLGTLSEKI